MEQFEIHATVRKSVGNGPARRIRRLGQTPAVLYGPQTEPVLLSVNTRDLEQLLKKGNIGQIILKVVIQNGKKVTKPAMIKDLQTHPVSRNFLHVDFYEIDMNREIRVMVPVVTKGKCKGVELGGLLQIIRRELEVLCLPGNIPDTVEIDVTELDVGDSVHVQEVPLGDGIQIPADVNFTVVTVLSPKVEAAAAEEEEEAEVEAAAAEEAEEASETAKPTAEE